MCERHSSNSFHVAATSRERAIGQHGERRSGPGSEVYDVTGAGDTVLATLALAVAAGASMREGATLGNSAAGVVVTKLGTATLGPNRIDCRNPRHFEPRKRPLEVNSAQLSASTHDQSRWISGRATCHCVVRSSASLHSHEIANAR